MADNFEFLESIDKELYSAIQDAQKLFRDDCNSQASIVFQPSSNFSFLPKQLTALQKVSDF